MLTETMTTVLLRLLNFFFYVKVPKSLNSLQLVHRAGAMTPIANRSAGKQFLTAKACCSQLFFPLQTDSTHACLHQ